MKVKEIVTKKDADLLGKITELTNQVTKIRFELSTKESTKTSQIREHRKTIARIKTILKERELQRKEESDEKKA